MCSDSDSLARRGRLKGRGGGQEEVHGGGVGVNVKMLTFKVGDGRA